MKKEDLCKILKHCEYHNVGLAIIGDDEREWGIAEKKGMKK